MILRSDEDDDEEWEDDGRGGSPGSILTSAGAVSPSLPESESDEDVDVES